jgi:bifunctional isochorismate lyase/aryl carrier protein
MREGFVFTPDKAALMIIDMQKHFCSKDGAMYVPGVERVIRNIQQIQQGFLDRKQPVIFTRHIDAQDGRSLMPRWWDTQFKLDDPLTEITEQLDTSQAQVITKPQYDAFLFTDLENILNTHHIKQVAVTGVLTNCCCESTARDAFMRGFEVYFVADATSTYSKEMHEASLLNLSYAFGVVLQTEDVVAAFPA